MGSGWVRLQNLPREMKCLFFLSSVKLDHLVVSVDPPSFVSFYFPCGAKCAQVKDDDSLNDCEILVTMVGMRFLFI